MELTIKKWRLEPRTEADIRTVTFLLTTDLPDLPEKIAQISLSGSVMTQVGEYIQAEKDSEDYALQSGRLAAALLKQQLEMNASAIYSSDLRFVYTSEKFPFGAVFIPDIDSPQDWKFEV